MQNVILEKCWEKGERLLNSTRRMGFFVYKCLGSFCLFLNFTWLHVPASEEMEAISGIVSCCCRLKAAHFFLVSFIKKTRRHPIGNPAPILSE